jgi:hypothetical protein
MGDRKIILRCISGKQIIKTGGEWNWFRIMYNSRLWYEK